MTRRIVTSLDQVKGVKTRAAEKTGRGVAREEVEEEKEVWKMHRKHSTEHESIQSEKKRYTYPLKHQANESLINDFCNYLDLH